VTSDAPTLALLTEPNQGVDPLLDQVRAARHTVDLVMYELSDPSFEAALIADAHRGVKERVLLNNGYYGEGSSANQAAYDDLMRHGVPVHWTSSHFALTHQKTLVIDDREADILTLNLTSEYYATSRDFAVIDRQPADVAAIEAHSTRIGRAGRSRQPLEVGT
jgi:cardiolipin synthase